MELMFDEAEGDGKIPTPSGSTLSRGRAKVDVVLMLIRRIFWKEHVKDTSIQLGFLAALSSLQNYTNVTLTLIALVSW